MTTLMVTAPAVMGAGPHGNGGAIIAIIFLVLIIRAVVKK
jgi:hypothetical protein